MLRIFTWDWKEQPPLKDICESLEDAMSQIAPDLGGCNYGYYITGSDSYAFYVADHNPSDEELARAYQS